MSEHQEQKKTQKEELPQLINYQNVDDLPIKDQERTCTDVFCAGIGIVFSLILFILAMVLFNYQTFLKSSFPADSDGNLCGAQLTGYPYLYFASPPQIQRRVCVAECPKQGDQRLNCYTTSDVGCRFGEIPGLQVSYYQSKSETNRVGQFCWPTDQSLKQQILEKTQLQEKYKFMNSIDVVFLCCFLAGGLSILYLLLTQFFPKIVNIFAVYIGIIFTLGLTICFFTYDSNSPWKIPIGIALLIAFVILVFNLCKNGNTLKIHGVFLDASTKMLCLDRCCTFIYIPIFLAFIAIFAVLWILQLQSFLGGGKLKFDKTQSIFWQFQDENQILLFLLIVQGWWGLVWIKQAFNFCVSGNAVAWYHQTDWAWYTPFCNLWSKHFGSVVAGSIMTGFFTVFDYLFDLLKHSDKQEDGCCDRCVKFTFGCCIKVFDLVRSDAMAYINATGNPYCNAARYCQYLTEKSLLLEGSQSTSRTYRICAHLLICGIVGISGLYLKGSITALTILFIVTVALFISTLFISIHADAAQALIILFLNNEEIEVRHILKKNRGSRKNPKNYEQINWKHKQLKEQVDKMRLEQNEND